MIINTITFLYFPVLTYSVRLFRKKYKGGGENFDLEPNSPSSAFLIDDINCECSPCIFCSVPMTSNLELPIDGQMFQVRLIID